MFRRPESPPEHAQHRISISQSRRVEAGACGNRRQGFGCTAWRTPPGTQINRPRSCGNQVAPVLFKTTPLRSLRDRCASKSSLRARSSVFYSGSHLQLWRLPSSVSLSFGFRCLTEAPQAHLLPRLGCKAAETSEPRCIRTKSEAFVNRRFPTPCPYPKCPRGRAHCRTNARLKGPNLHAPKASKRLRTEARSLEMLVDV